MMFVTPTTTLTSGVYGRFRIEPPMKQRMPMMSESRSLPRTKPLKISSVLRVPRMTRFAAPLAQNAIEQLAAAGKALLLHRQQVDGEQ